LDCWIVQSKDGFGHQWFIGQNPDGTFWSTDLAPKSSGGIRTPNWGWLPSGLRNVPIECKAEDTSPEQSPFDPTNLESDMELVKHIKCSKEVDKRTKQHVSDTAKEHTMWNAWPRNCRDYTSDLNWFVIGAKLRERTDQRKQAD
jgi:hypothetical protein